MTRTLGPKIVTMLLASIAAGPPERGGPDPRVGIEPPAALAHAMTAFAGGALDDAVRDELGLTPEQIDALAKLSLADLDAQQAAEDRTGRATTRRERFERSLARLRRVLDAGQLERAWPIYLRLEGPRALEFPTFADRLRLSVDQRERVAAVVRRHQSEHRGNFVRWFSGRGGLTPEGPKLLRHLIQTAEHEDQEILALLSPRQRADWSALLGPATRPRGLTGSSPSLSRDGRVLLFESAWANMHAFVAVADLERATATRLTDADSWGVCPRFSPDGQTIVFSSSREGTFDLYLTDRTGAGLKRLTQGDLIADEGASFSPDGSTLVFGTRSSGLSTIRRDGTKRTQILDRGHRPRVSPDGRTVVFQRTPPNRLIVHRAESLGLVAADGSNARDLPVRGFDPAFAPDGRRIAFIASPADPARQEVFLADPDGANARPVTTTGGLKGDPSFTPDGRRLLFWASTQSPGGGDLQELDLETSRCRRLTLDAPR